MARYIPPAVKAGVYVVFPSYEWAENAVDTHKRWYPTNTYRIDGAGDNRWIVASLDTEGNTIGWIAD